jgi:hypothetical protein
MPIVRRTRADVDSLKGETAGDKSCKDARPFGERAKVARVR